jgi:hypothetical protein
LNHAPRRIGYWALLDVERFGPALSARVAREEILRRQPDAVVRTLAPQGHVHPVRADGGEPAEPLGPWGPAGATELAKALDCLIIAGELVFDAEALAALYREGTDVASHAAAVDLQLDGLGPALEAGCPVLWQAVAVPAGIGTDGAQRLRDTLSRLPLVSVRDDLSRRRLEELGVEHDIDVVADPLLVVTRLLTPDVLEKRLTYLRLMGWYPVTGAPLVVHGGKELLPTVPELADALSGVVQTGGITSVVLAELGPNEGDVADALSQAVGVPAFRLPAEVSAEDVVAAVAAAAGLIGTSHHASTVAIAYGRPTVLLQPGEYGNLGAAYAQASRRSGSSSELAALVQALDGQFDRIAGIVGGARAGGNVRRMEEELLSLRRAHEMQGATFGGERSYYADRIIELESDVERLTVERGHLRHWGEAESRGRLHAEQELGALYGTRTFRWTAAVRGAYFGLRSLRRRR